MNSVQDAMNAKAKVRQLLRDMPGIDGIGVTWGAGGSPCVRVNVHDDLPSTEREKIPGQVDGVEVHVETIGPIKVEHAPPKK